DEDAFLDVGFTFTVNAASGYFVTSIVVNGQVFSVEGASSVTHTIDTVSGDLEISANVELVQPKPFTGLVENLSDQWKTVELPQHYINPVLVTTLITTESSTPVVTRVTNVTGNSFDIKVQRADTSIESLGQFSATYFVVEEGAFNESDHGIKLEAFLYDSHATAGKNNWVADSITPVNTFNSPVLYGQVMSNNDENWSAFFSYGSSRTQPVSSNQYNIGKHIGEDVLTSRNSETLGCIIAESGVWELDDMKFTFSLSSDTVDGIDNEGVELAVNHGNLSIVTINGVDGGDGGWAVFLNSANTSSGKVKCAIDEDIIGDSERAHTTEQVSILSAEVNAEPKLNTGVIDFVNHEWQTIELPETYTSMVVLVTPVYDSSSVPLVARVKNAVGNSFDVRMQRVDGLDTPVEAVKITYLVAEEGVYTEVEHGISMEAVKYKSTITDNTKSWIGEERTLFNTYNSPVVLGQVMSSNDDRWSAFWSRGVSRTDAPSTVLYTGKHVAQDVDKSRSEETVSYVVFESGSYEVNSLTYTIGLGSDSITGMDNSGTYYNVDCSYAVLSQSGMDGSDGSWAVLNGLEGSTDGSLNIVVDEDTIGDGERQHITEQVAYILVNP
ncbi:MAG: hypothetical protein NE330_13280, partial [Lentisphaeraceae bacterium]|nr:hypothetical protein [Lentisphaeraceae bacterium]